MKSAFGDFEMDDDLGRVDFGVVHGWLAGSYWTPGILRERVQRAARHSSLVVGAYAGRAQAGFMRVVSDRARFAYVADVFVGEAFRKRGLAKAMVRFALEHPEHSAIDKWLLATRDAHEVYRAIGFAPLPKPEMYMVLKPAAR